MREKLRYQVEYQVGWALRSLREWFRRKPHAQRRLMSGGLGVMVVAMLGLVAAMPAITSASEVDALGNGGFEHGFSQVNGCGVVGLQWDCFTNGGAAAYGFYEDQWESVVYEGKSSQMIEINTKNLAAGDNDRYAGISQTARVVPGATYKFSLRGMIRTTNSEGDPWRYSVQVGWLNGPHGDWRDVTNWTDVGWNTYYKRTEPGAFNAFQTHLVPDSELVTVFVRVWKKWGVAYEEIDVNLDAISLTGPAAHGPKSEPQRPDAAYPGIGGPVQQGQPGPQEPHRPEGRPNEAQPQDGRDQEPRPQQQGPQSSQPQNRPQDWAQEPQSYRPSAPDHDYPVACGGEDLLYNGSFEAGFTEVPWGDVGRGWNAFTNGGAVNYGFYDEEWDVVVADGHHGQLIEISSKSVYPTDSDRYAGIYQRVGGLHPGTTYELTLRGELRGEGNEDDPYRFAAQWGLGKEADWQSVDEWTTMDLGPIAVRTQPVPLAQYKVRFEAPAPNVVLFIRGWKKFGITNVEMDFNLDAISLRACEPTGPGRSQPSAQPEFGPSERPYEGHGNPTTGNPGMGNPNPGERPAEQGGASCLYVVKPGDMLSQIALDYGVSMDVIARANGINDPSSIYVGQKFEIPGCNTDSPRSEPGVGGPERYSPPSQDGPVRPDDARQGERPGDAPVSGPAMRPTAEERPQPIEAEWTGPISGPDRPAGGRTYVVQGGDMLSWIAQEYGVDAYDLAVYNGIDNLNFIYEGQVLEIPD